KQKLALSCALIHTPRVLFLDEPTNGVDPLYRREFWRILYQLQRRQVTIFLSTAYMDEAERCFRVGLLHEGRLMVCDTPANVKKRFHGEMLELRFSNSRRAAAILRKRFSNRSVTLFGDRIHLVTRDPQGDISRSRAETEKAGIDLVSSRVVEPGLEDVFISELTQGSGRTQADE
nr:AAA family ATPase [Nitrospinaceae bacterium]NIR56503.1 AAA family ATPase [Nitrospinaceae bacterium]NIS86961.1 AAA family ATPase [Nitrospinaceae bacterium]NIT83805.1 AAA family ATPase [Nitrospinaceae bacterium]NIU46011.1 AAA family ATPase [Nitrospinaceae bacterium]